LEDVVLGACLLKPERWEDPSRVEAGQAWDYVGDDEGMLVIVTEVRDHPPTALDRSGRRNASVYVVEHSDGYAGLVISYSEKHLRRSFRRVA
jgi:hypothetical protein